MRAVRSLEVVEPLPFTQFCFEIDVAFVAEKLVEFLSIGSVRSLDLSVQLRRAAFDIGVADAEVLDVPVKFGLELMAIVGSDFLDAEGELLDDVVDTIDRVGLRMLLVDFQGTNPCGVIDGSILETTNHFALFSNECQELDVHLDVMPWNLLIVALRMNFAHAGPARKAIQPIAPLNARHSGV